MKKLCDGSRIFYSWTINFVWNDKCTETLNYTGNLMIEITSCIFFCIIISKISFHIIALNSSYDIFVKYLKMQVMQECNFLCSSLTPKIKIKGGKKSIFSNVVRGFSIRPIHLCVVCNSFKTISNMQLCSCGSCCVLMFILVWTEVILVLFSNTGYCGHLYTSNVYLHKDSII